MVISRKDGTSGRRPSLDALEAGFDDACALANAGLMLRATLAERLGLEALYDEASTRAAAAARPGQGARSCCNWKVWATLPPRFPRHH